MTGRSSQRKGRAAELELANTLQDYGAQAGAPANHGTTADLYGLPDIHIECKRVERLNISAAMEQARRDSLKFRDGMPCVFHRRNREQWLVSMALTDWLTLYGAYERQKTAESGKEDAG